MEKRKPSATLTTTPQVKAAKGFQPVAASALKRVVRPMQRKHRMNAQPRRPLMGLSTCLSMVAATSGVLAASRR